MLNIKSQVLYNFYKSTPMRNGILNWYPFNKNSTILEQSDGALTELLKSKCNQVISFTDEFNGDKKFDYLVIIDPNELKIELLEKYHSYLKEHGRLLLAFENPYGLQYFAGKRNPQNDIPYAFWAGESKKEVENRLDKAGFQAQKWYYPFTNHYFTREVYSENYLPNEFLNHRGHEMIEDDYTKEFDERGLWKEIIRGEAFAFLCNSYLVEARVSFNDEACDVDYAAITAYREYEKALITTIHSDGTAKKQAIYAEGKQQLLATAKHHAELEKLGVNVLPLHFHDNVLLMKRVKLPTLWDYMTRRLSEGTLDEKVLCDLFDKVHNEILKTAKSGKCYWEMVPANCFYDETNDTIIFFDQEYMWNGVDYRVVLVRAIHALLYSFEFKKSDKTADWLECIKQRYNLADDWDVLADIADKQTIDFVFNPDSTKPIDRFTDRAWMRMCERIEENFKQASERAIQRKVERERYNKMCRVAVAIKALNATQIAIYGYGIRGKMLRLVLEMNDTDVVCIIDKAKPIVRGITLVTEIEKMEVASDMIIVTPLKDANKIADELKLKVKCPVMTIEELLNG